MMQPHKQSNQQTGSEKATQRAAFNTITLRRRESQTLTFFFEYHCTFFRLLQRRLLPDSPEAQQMLFKNLVKEKSHNSRADKLLLGRGGL